MLLSSLSFVVAALTLQVAAAPAADGLLAVTTSPTPTSNTHCPTITKTGTICPSCAVPMCIKLSTISNPCDCPTAIPTVVVDYPCGSGCHAGCGTAYSFASSTSTCTSSTSTTTSTTTTKPSSSSKCTSSTGPLTSSCAATVTVNAYPTQSCAYSCTSAFCIIDKFVTAPCGCKSVQVATSTSTLPCPTSSGCELCMTGFPFTTTAACTTESAAPRARYRAVAQME
ncbi:hypothetical protein CONLIGDRAFT_466390 [Coniochaeta ligniaria NRRL 30616]|uniref:Uncharacterized protein n=1 Tax=Coniochaeta ligniaria NRRL 30616 TaxID=1408157 RepID=A0A1J7JF43_9PEZI|nr:hypothetical protein CONLIGDRAFT_466390 [Coniochaeta ligniaria NRRL 30616]